MNAVETQPREDLQVHLVSGALRRHAVLVVLLVIGFAAGAGAYASSTAPSYAATASVLLRATQGNAFSPASASSGPEVTIAMGTEAGVARSPRVAAIASKILGATIKPQSQSMTVTSPPNTVILEIQYSAGSARTAQMGAQALADAVLGYRAERSESARRFQFDALSAQVKTASAELTKASTAAAAIAAPPEAGQRVQLLAAQVSELQNSLSTLAATDTTPGTVISPAVLPTEPSGLAAPLWIAAGAVFGFAVGMVIAIWRELRDDRVRASSEVSIAGLPVLAHVRTPRKGAGTEPGLLADPDVADAYRQARAGIKAATGSPCSLTVSDLSTYTHAGEVATNLSLCLAKARHPVTLVSTTAPGDVESLLGMGAGPGLAEALERGTPPNALTHQVQSLHVLSAGADGSDVGDLVAGERFADVLASLKAQADFVIVAAGPADRPEGATVALATDAMVLVVEDRRTTHAEVGRVADRLSQLNITVVGVICVPATGARLLGALRRSSSPTPKGQGTRLTASAGAEANDVLVGMPSGSARIATSAGEPTG